MNNEFVSVPRATVSQLAYGELESASLTIRDELRALLAQPAAQHQGEPLCWTYKIYEERRFCPIDPRNTADDKLISDEMHSVQPLYTHADTGEVERLRAALTKITQIEYQESGDDWEELDEAIDIAKAALSASAEPEVKS